jgi:hypothetical protein
MAVASIDSMTPSLRPGCLVGRTKLDRDPHPTSRLDLDSEPLDLGPRGARVAEHVAHRTVRGETPVQTWPDPWATVDMVRR